MDAVAASIKAFGFRQPIEQLKDQKIVVDKADSDKIAAEEAYKIQLSSSNCGSSLG